MTVQNYQIKRIHNIELDNEQGKFKININNLRDSERSFRSSQLKKSEESAQRGL